MKKTVTPSKQLAACLSKYTPDIARTARAALAKMRKRLPGAVEFVYDNYNALVIGFGPTERPSDALFSLALYPRWVNVYFLDGASLHDPHGVLKGAGKMVRFVVLTDATVLDRPEVRALIAQALDDAVVPMPKHGKRRLRIRAVSAKQRSRRPKGVA